MTGFFYPNKLNYFIPNGQKKAQDIYGFCSNTQHPIHPPSKPECDLLNLIHDTIVKRKERD